MSRHRLSGRPPEATIAALPAIVGFPPIAGADARCLILGSMPGVASLAAFEYYAHRQNAFWPILNVLLGLPADADYATRVTALIAARIALWDVLAACRRPGSLDAHIEPASEVANDLAGFLAGHPGVTRIYFNGGKAEAAFRRHVAPTLGARPPALTRLPSTSPAFAGLARADKLAAWRQILA